LRSLRPDRRGVFLIFDPVLPVCPVEFF
jgi:hypothetical protein